MPSPKRYNRDDVLDRAIELFRRNGYSATSTAELVDALGMNRKSMYAEFGSKQELFESALERYSKINHPETRWGRKRNQRRFFTLFH